jgi:BlaI family transcriptional regulator, penicillinase repressor
MKRDLKSLILTRQELLIMKVVWARDSATVREVCDVLSRQKPTAYTTVLTLMGILEEKGALAHVRSGRAYVYRPLLSCEQATHNQVHDLVVRLFDGQPEKLIESVLESELEGSESRAAVLKLLEPRLEEQVPQPAVSP